LLFAFAATAFLGKTIQLIEIYNDTFIDGLEVK